MLGEGLTEEPLAVIWMLNEKSAVIAPRKIWDLLQNAMCME